MIDKLDKVTLYVDESGNTSINSIEGNDKYYIIVLVIVKKEDSDKFERDYINLVKRFNKNNKFMKYSHLKKKEWKEEFLSELRNLNFRYLTLSVEKTKLLHDGGFAFRKSFYKFFHKLAFLKLEKIYDEINIISDKYIDEKFEDSFIKYLRNSVNNDTLFNTINFINKSDVIQLSDILSGIIRDYKTNSNNLNASILRNIIVDKESIFLNFPNNINSDSIISEPLNPSENNVISNITINSIDKNFDQLSVNSRLVLFYLLSNLELNPNNYTFAEELISLINDNHNITLSKNEIKQSIIKELRNKGIIVTSSSLGYKLPISIEDYKRDFDLNVKNSIPALIKINKYISLLSLNLNLSKSEIIKRFANSEIETVLRTVSEVYGE